MGRRTLFNDDDESGWMRRTRPTASAEDFDITPMIDCTFLLLIFFMVSSTLQGGRELNLPPAEFTEGVDGMRGTLFVTILEPDRADGLPQILLGDGSGEAGTVADVQRYVEQGVSEGKGKVILKAEGEVTHGIVSEVAQAIKSVSGVEMFLAVRDK